MCVYSYDISEVYIHIRRGRERITTINVKEKNLIIIFRKRRRRRKKNENYCNLYVFRREIIIYAKYKRVK